MPKHILSIEDEPDIRQLITLYLEKEGFRVSSASNGREGLTLARTEKPDLIILDLMLPEMDGLEVCKHIRSDRHIRSTPIVMLTARGEETDQVIGLELGADDYVTKPFSPKTLVARVKALLRRVDRSANDGPQHYHYGNLHMDLLRHEVLVDGKEIPLTAKEFGLLEHLLQHPGQVLTREILLNAVWGYDYYGTTRTVDVHIRRLKQKISYLNEAITSIKSLGYKLKDLSQQS